MQRAIRKHANVAIDCWSGRAELVTVLASLGVPIPVYLDQNVFSALQKDKLERGRLLQFLDSMSSKRAVFVYSMIHVDECRESAQPEAFAKVMEEISAHLLEWSDSKDSNTVLSPMRAAELILAEPDILDEAARRMEDMLKPLHFAAGWLDEIEERELKNVLVEGVSSFWKLLEAELPQGMQELLKLEKMQVIESIQSLSL